MDFPSYQPVNSPIITPWSVESLGLSIVDGVLSALGLASSATWPSANMAFFYPFVLWHPVTAYQLLWWVGSSIAGNIDVGIYDAEGVRKVSSGSTAMGGSVNTVQALNITDTPLAPGRYFLAGACNSALGTVYRSGNADELVLPLCPVYEQASAFPLPATASPVISTQLNVPIVAIGIQTVPTF